MFSTDGETHRIRLDTLLGKLLAVADHIGQHHAGGGLLLELFVFDEAVHAVQGHAAIVADDPAAAVGVGQAGDDMAAAAGAHFGRVGIKNAGVVGLAVNGEEFLHFGVEMIAVILAGLLCHPDPAVGHHRALEGLIGLEADDLFLLLIQITGPVAEDGGNDLGIHIQHAARLTLFLGELQHLLPQGGGIGGGAFQKALVAIVGSIVAHDKITHVDLGFPAAADKFFPFVTHVSLPPSISVFLFPALLCKLYNFRHLFHKACEKCTARVFFVVPIVI